jgi:hypothetical protein
LHRGVSGVKDPCGESPVQGRLERLPPLCREVVFAQSLVFGAKLLALGLIGCNAKAAHRAKGIPRELSEPAEVALGQLPVRASSLISKPFARVDVRHRASAERKAAVSPAGSFGHPALFVDPHAEPRLRKRVRRRAARDPGTDDRHVDATGTRSVSELWTWLFQPV